ncbi:MAG: hypothetical protein ABI589_07830 [Burkholderiales bacterium]
MGTVLSLVEERSLVFVGAFAAAFAGVFVAALVATVRTTAAGAGLEARADFTPVLARVGCSLTAPTALAAPAAATPGAASVALALPNPIICRNEAVIEPPDQEKTKKEKENRNVG